MAKVRNQQGQIVQVNLKRHAGRLSLQQKLLLSQKRQAPPQNFKRQILFDDLSQILNEPLES
jgi:hypothetical protein